MVAKTLHGPTPRPRVAKTLPCVDVTPDGTVVPDEGLPHNQRAGMPAADLAADTRFASRRRLVDVPSEDLIELLARRGMTAADLLQRMSLTPARKV